MLLILNEADMVADRPQREASYSGRYWLLKTTDDAHASHWVARELSDLCMAQELLRNKPEYSAVFDVIAQRIWVPEGASPDIVEAT